MTDEPILAEDGYAVGRLIAFALKSARPTREGEYKQLIDQYIYEDVFARATDQVLEGLGLQILNDSTESLRSGLVLGCLGQSSPFAPNIESHARGLTREQQMALGVIHLGIMSFFFPQVEDEDDLFRSRMGTPTEIAKDIRQACDTLATELKVSEEAQGGAPSNTRMSFESYLSLAPAPTRTSGYIPKSTQVGLVYFALMELQRNHFLAIDGGDGVNTRFVSLPKYRVYVQRLSSHRLAQMIRGAQSSQSQGEKHG